MPPHFFSARFCCTIPPIEPSALKCCPIAPCLSNGPPIFWAVPPSAPSATGELRLASHSYLWDLANTPLNIDPTVPSLENILAPSPVVFSPAAGYLYKYQWSRWPRWVENHTICFTDSCTPSVRSWPPFIALLAPCSIVLADLSPSIVMLYWNQCLQSGWSKRFFTDGKGIKVVQIPRLCSTERRVIMMTKWFLT